jgi:O-antigen/teichoic acid export membrane protein
LTGFLLTLVFQPKFADLDDFQRTVYLVLVGLAGLTTVCALGPVLLHRDLFRRKMKGTIVAASDVLLRCTLAGIGLVLIGTQLLVFDVAVDHEAGLVAAAVAAVLVLTMAVLPIVIRRRSGRRGRPNAQ